MRVESTSSWNVENAETSLAGKSMADGKIPRQEPDLYELIGKKLLVPKNT